MRSVIFVIVAALLVLGGGSRMLATPGQGDVFGGFSEPLTRFELTSSGSGGGFPQSGGPRERFEKILDCKIKGNIAPSGRRIYFVPGQAYYETTRINPLRGERWFCTEAGARRAGWSKAEI